MNKLNYIKILIVIFLFVGSSCKKETLLTYNAKDNIYFNWISTGGVGSDSVSLTFGYSPLSVTDSTVFVPVQITGSASNVDREYSVTVDTSTTMLPTQYVLPQKYVLRAGMLKDTIPVKILRNANLLASTLKLVLNLNPTNSFETAIQTLSTVNVLRLRIFASDGLTAGPFWANVCAYYFGDFSVKKVLLLNQVTGMPLNFPSYGIIYVSGGTAQAAFYAITMSRYLQDQAAAGHPVYESDGVTLMTVGVAFQ